jgi:hypothetical protein
MVVNSADRPVLAADLAGAIARAADALRTYVPPAPAAGAASLTGFGTSGQVKSNSGRGNGPEGNPDPDPGNSAGHNQGGDGVVAVPGAGNPHGAGTSGGKKK